MKILMICFLLVTVGFKSTSIVDVKEKTNPNEYFANWNFIELHDPIVGRVIKHEKNMIACGRIATGSLTIMETNKDTIRVLSLCNYDDYQVNSIIKVLPRQSPSFYVSLPRICDIEGAYSQIDTTKKYKALQRLKRRKIRRNTEHHTTLKNCCYNEFDKIISTTTWGKIEEK